MNIYLISQDVNNDYDTYDSAVVYAPTEEDARMTHPSDYKHDWDGTMYDWSPWCDAREVQVDYLGETSEVVDAGVICASFNAG